MTGLDAGALVVEQPARARVLLRGADARAFLHRMSTNHVQELAPGDGRLNALLTDKGRLVDLVLHLDRGPQGVLLVGTGTGPALVAWLDRYLFTEKVELVDRSAVGRCAFVAGAGAPALVDALVPGAAALAPWAFVEGGPTLVARAFDRVTVAGARVPGFIVLGNDVPRANATPEEAEAARVAAGEPGPAEVTDRYTPLDLGMHDAIHWAKGCYVGQEVIARLDTYQKQHKALFALTAASVLAAGAPVLSSEGAPAGEVTSASPLPWGGQARALAVLKAAPGARVRVNDVDAVAEAPATAQTRHG